MNDNYRTAVNAAAIFSETDTAGIITYVNDRFCTISGYSAQELLGASHRILNSGEHPAGFFIEMWKTLANGQVWRGEICNRAKDGSLYWVDSTMVPLIDQDTQQVLKYISIRFDVTERRQLLHTLQWRVGHDVLTGLPNRALLSEQLNQVIDQARVQKRPLAVALLDLDDFKAINDRYGHAIGDLLLMEIANRLKDIMRGEDSVARLGGDEFVLILNDVRDVAELQKVMQRILVAISTLNSINALGIHTTASIGVALYAFDDEDADTLLRHADQAMYQAKQSGRNHFHLFNVSQDKQVKASHETVARVRQALHEGELCLYYQPKVNLCNGTVLGFEALLRWQHPQQGLVPPLTFLPQIEQTELIVEIGEWAIEQALTQIHQWTMLGHAWAVSVNIATRHVQKADFVQRLQSVLARHPQVAPQLLDLEILETVAIENIHRVSQCIEACQALGVTFSLDDFGTGYSSLNYLKRLPTQTIKIDQSFVRGIIENKDDLALTKAIIGLANAFDREVIAEGVETAAQAQLLVSLGCRLAQGYGIAKPMPAGQVLGWMEQFDPAWALAAHPETAR
jgi:diguanylate cyclase (GGDEF)-like protein/PAS domain S-box-containing protein